MPDTEVRFDVDSQEQGLVHHSAFRGWRHSVTNALLPSSAVYRRWRESHSANDPLSLASVSAAAKLVELDAAGG